jgi:lipopolysaccharide transport system ATP-binding protein
MSAILKVNDVSKVYRRYAKPSQRLREYLFGTSLAEEVHALHPITLRAAPGETIGIVGRNGSGKSTLLSLIAGVLTPTTGTIERHGSVAALLELGSGFNPDFTGRENIFFSGSVMGMSQAQVRERLDEIIAFADIGDFIDRPVRTYSSGMFVRLAFAVSSHSTASIFIIDEALAVGDVFFQQKCFARLRKLRDLGTTILFVSHDAGAVHRLCERAILLEHGHLVFDGNPRDAIEMYEARSLAQEMPILGEELSTEITRAELRNDNLVSWDVEVIDDRGKPTVAATSGDEVAVRITLRFHRSFSDPHVGFKLRDRLGIVLYETNTLCMRRAIGRVEAGDQVVVDFRFRLDVHQGDYSISLGIANDAVDQSSFKEQIAYIANASALSIARDLDSTIWSGIANLRPTVHIVTQPSGSLLPADRR